MCRPRHGPEGVNTLLCELICELNTICQSQTRCSYVNTVSLVNEHERQLRKHNIQCTKGQVYQIH